MKSTIENTAEITFTPPTEAELTELGFDAAAKQLNADREMARKLRIAFEHFRVVEPDHLSRFQAELKQKTLRNDGRNTWGMITEHDTLVFTPIKDYTAIPPKEALDELRKAKTLGCFDAFEVATIQSVRTVPDPIIFGTINGSRNKYYVCQWDNDVKIEDILRPEEG